jgi:class 3 adenylate cyclase
MRDPSDPYVQREMISVAINAMNEFVKGVARYADPLDEFGIHVRIGVNCGLVRIRLVAGGLTVLGSVVNQTQRLESLAKVDTICVSWDVVRILATPSFELRYGNRSNVQELLSTDPPEVVRGGGMAFEYNGLQRVKHGEAVYSFTLADA